MPKAILAISWVFKLSIGESHTAAENARQPYVLSW